MFSELRQQTNTCLVCSGNASRFEFWKPIDDEDPAPPLTADCVVQWVWTSCFARAECWLCKRNEGLRPLLLAVAFRHIALKAVMHAAKGEVVQAVGAPKSSPSALPLGPSASCGALRLRPRTLALWVRFSPWTCPTRSARWAVPGCSGLCVGTRLGWNLCLPFFTSQGRITGGRTPPLPSTNCQLSRGFDQGCPASMMTCTSWSTRRWNP